MLENNPTPEQVVNLDTQLEDEAFELYCGVSITKARELCDESDGELEFNDEFWIPFQYYLISLRGN